MSTIPKSYFCSITHELMTDPVMDRDGNSYEREAITKWLVNNNNSPITRKPLSINDLTTNRALRDGIQELLSKNPELTQHKLDDIISSDSHTIIKRLPVNITSKLTYDNDNLLVSLDVPESQEGRAPADIVAALDISGSMGSDAAISINGSTERDGLSLLDIVRHAVKTILGSLTENDRLCLVSYHTSAECILEFTYMDSIGKQKAIRILDGLIPLSTTNIWDGLHTSLEEIREKSRPGCNSAVILLTDGVPNIIPPRGHIPMLEKYLDQYNNLDTVVHTCGFGYHLDSELLDNISNRCGGMYTFIPDSSMVGTIMVNLISNILSVAVKKVKVNIITDTPIRLSDSIDNFVVTSWGGSIELGTISYGQCRDLVIPVDTIENVNLNIEYLNHGSNKVCKLENSDIQVGINSYMLDQILRDKVVSTINLLTKYAVVGDTDQINTHLKTLVDCFDVIVDVTKYGEDLYQDVVGQITQAVTNLSWYNKWGKHYLPSLKRSHQLQLCNNFKDPGIQHYGASMFREIRDDADEMFCKLPPPKPSNHVGGIAAPVNLSNYNNSNNPCFAGSCLVKMMDGSKKRVDSIVKGDVVLCNHLGQSSKVRCILKTLCTDGRADLVLTDTGLLVTPWHPILFNDKWEFPIYIDDYQCENFKCEAVYSFLLENGYTITINNTVCITLGHNLTGEVISHPYFGSKRVVEDLVRLSGWDNGLITITPDRIQRDPVTSIIIGIL